ncbi:MAG: DUF2227 family putative metal-binding protein [Chloroflexota bacterium]
MASGVQHERASTRLILFLQPLLLLSLIGLAIAWGLEYLPLFHSLLLAIGLVGFLFGLYVGRRVTPDLDIDEVITRQTRRYLNRHRILGWLWRIYWLPYALYHPHRGISHVPLIGTLGRWVYLFFLPIVITYWLTWMSGPQPWILLMATLFWMAEFAGQSMQDLLHIWMDR